MRQSELTTDSTDTRNKKRRSGMNARQKLNLAYVNGAVVIAGVVGMLAKSWGVFCLALVVLVVIHLTSGGIRPERRG
jgi:hypothetical protein